jgi:hypothetical protein
MYVTSRGVRNESPVTCSSGTIAIDSISSNARKFTFELWTSRRAPVGSVNAGNVNGATMISALDVFGVEYNGMCTLSLVITISTRRCPLFFSSALVRAVLALTTQTTHLRHTCRRRRVVGRLTVHAHCRRYVVRRAHQLQVVQPRRRVANVVEADDGPHFREQQCVGLYGSDSRQSADGCDAGNIAHWDQPANPGHG